VRFIAIFNVMGNEKWDSMSGGSLYGGGNVKDPYISGDPYFSLFDTKPTSNGVKKSDPLKFSDPLSFGGESLSTLRNNGVGDPLAFSSGVRDPLAFSSGKGDPLAFSSKDNDKKTEGGGGETTETESRDSDGDEEDDWPSAPPVDYLEHVQGYEMVSFDTVSVPPPAEIPTEEKEEEGGDEKSPPPPPAAVLQPQTGVNLTQQQARSALLSHISNKCCYGSGAAKQMQVTSMDYVPAHHYELQTFTEKRETSWTYAPHKGGEVDGPARGRAPLPWEIEEPPVSMFKDEVRVVTVPHTGVVKACHKCRGTGGMTCKDCYGKGWVRCLHCHGDVYLSNDSGSLGRDRCYYCQHSKHGHGQQDCSKCQAKGKVSCATCEGSAHIRCYIQLSISWKVNTAEHIVEKLNIPEDLIRDVSGQVAFEEEHPKVCPVDAFKDEVIKMASAQLVASHAANYLDQRILRQRHQVRIVPVTKVTYEYKGRSRGYFVYGYENKVYLPPASYPQTCCWGCSVM